MLSEGRVFVISAPSGTGKTTLARKAVEDMDNLAFSVSHTTRPPREGEKNGRDYFFVDEDEFLRMIKNGDFLEWARVFSHYYGTSRRYIMDELSKGKDIILDIDEQGAGQVKKTLGVSAVLVMLLPPSMEELERRIESRDGEINEKVHSRLEKADLVIKQRELYDYVIINDEMERALGDLCSVVRAERCRTARKKGFIEGLLAEFNGRN